MNQVKNSRIIRSITHIQGFIQGIGILTLLHQIWNGWHKCVNAMSFTTIADQAKRGIEKMADAGQFRESNKIEDFWILLDQAGAAGKLLRDLDTAINELYRAHKVFTDKSLEAIQEAKLQLIMDVKKHIEKEL